MNKTWTIAREAIRVWRIIYITLVCTARTALQTKQGRLYSAVFTDTLLIILLAYSVYWMLMIGCALDDNCAAAQGY